MKTIMKRVLAVTSLSLLVVSCGNKVADSGKKVVLKENISHEYEEIKLTMDDGGQSLSVPQLAMSVKEGESAIQPLFIRNANGNGGNALPLSFDMSNLAGQTGLTIDTSDCDGKSPLAPKKYCYVRFQVDLTSEDLAADYDSGNISFSISGVAYSISIAHTAIRDNSVIAGESLVVKNESLDFGNVVEGNASHSLYSVLKNDSRTESIELSQTGLQSELQASPAAASFDITSSCPNVLKPKRACLIVVSMKDSLLVGPVSDSLSVVGGSISLSGNVIADLSAEDYAVVSGTEDLGNFDGVLNQKVVVSNSSAEYSTSAPTKLLDKAGDYPDSSLTYSELVELVFGEALIITDTCGEVTVLQPNQKCSINFDYDPQRVPYGVVRTHTVEINGTNHDIVLEGQSPCDAGQKLNADKSECIDNLGVFDSGDSLFGYAKFQ